MLVADENTFRLEDVTATRISKILVPIDFSKRCADVASFALSLAGRFHSKVTLLHVEKFFDGNPYATEDVRWVKEQMANFLPQAAEDTDIWRTIHANPDVAEEILSTAMEIKADLIVMPTPGYGTIRRALLGSIAARVLRDAPCPVWTSAHVNQRLPDEWLEPGRILCALNSVPDGTPVLSWASTMASQLNAELCVAWSRESLKEAHTEIDQQERAYPIYAEAVIEAGNLSDNLRRISERMRSKLLVVSRSFWNASGDPGLGMYQVVREAPCAVVNI